MSIFFDFEIGPSGRRFRKAVDGDKCNISLLLDESHSKLFGQIDIGGLIELSTLSICMVNAKQEVLGFVALCDHPNVPGVDPAHWEIWIRNLFQKFYLASNTLFIHLMCCAAEVEDFFMEEALVSVFRSDAYLLHIVMMVPSMCSEDCYMKYQTFRKRNVYKHKAQLLSDASCAYFFYSALRRDFCPKLKIRRAVEEDNDDITAFLDRNCPTLKELYGEYYISEIIGRHPEMKREIIVAERDSVAVGVMCLNADINYEMLQESYELEPYHGLKKTQPFEKEQNKRSNKLLTAFGEPIMRGHWSPFQKIAKCKTEPIDDEPSKEKLVEIGTPKTISRVNFEREAGLRQSYEFYLRQSSDDFSDKFPYEPPVISKSIHSVVDMLEEDPFEYEIVNIDTNLFAVPEAIARDDLSNEIIPEPRKSRISQIQRNINRAISNKKTSTPEPFHTYKGDPDAFMIELYGFREDIDERHGFDLLEGAFEIMKNYNYCIIRVPCHEKSFPLLQNFCFVPSKSTVCSKYALYVAHRSSVLGKLRVRRAEIMDIPQIAQLLQSLDGKETLWTVEETILKRSELQAFVFLSGVALVGVGILEPPEHIDFIRAKLNMDSYHTHKYHFTGMGTNAGFSTVKAALVYPVFEPHFRFFIRDMMRQSDVKSLLWLTGYRNKWVIHKINSLALAMIPLLPRKFELEYGNIEGLNRFHKLTNTLTLFSTWFLNKKLTSVPRVNIHTRIVIVGSSRTAMSFINKLLFSDSSSYLFFTNVTLISRNGLPYVRHWKTGLDTMFLIRRSSSDRYLKSVPYTYYLNVIRGVMVEINKKEKYIKLANESRCYYDMLFLLIGKQYQHPGYLKAALERERSLRVGTFRYTRLDDPDHHEELDCVRDTPDNVFIVTDRADANKALKYVNNIIAFQHNYTIIVYGASIHAYCCLATLIDLKIPGENIVFVEPFPPRNPAKTRVSLFCNEYVDSAVIKMLETLKIRVFRSYYFHTWTMNFDKVATHVEFLSYFERQRFECSAFFYYGKRSVDEQAFIAINKSGMAYDGGIVIDHEFRTRDPAIYAAGPATRYNRRLYADSKRHKYYDPTEVGDVLGAQIRDQLDPLFTEKKDATSKSLRFSLNTLESFCSKDTGESMNRKTCESDVYKLPEFKKPKVTYCMLPGGLQYLEIRPPALKSPHHYVQSLAYHGFVMETFKTGYFKLHLTKDFIVDGITCLTSEKECLEIFINLYGLSAVVLNNVHLRFTAKKLDDFYEFFRAPWAVFLYHDQTEELFAMVKELLPKGQPQGDTLRDGLQSVARKLKKTDSFTADTKLLIRSKFEKSPHIAAITDYVLEWLSENDVVLPMYFLPTSSNKYMHDVNRNPAFRKRKRTLSKLLTAIY